MIANQLKQLGKYRIDAVIGQGNMGVVYKGYDEDIDRPVALKMVHNHLTSGEGGEEMAVRFRQEAQAAARCLHGNIVAVFDYGTSDDSQYIVMEYVQGTDLRTLLKRRKRLPLGEAVDVMGQVLSALEYAHENGVIHRDIKPANIMVTHQGRVKVTDFGIAKLNTSELTNAGMVIGTPSYMSPEGGQGLPVDARSDLYSAGLVFYELVTGIRPRPGQDLSGTLQQDLEVALVDMRAAGQLHAVLRRVLRQQPQTRLVSARQFLVALDGMHLTELSEGASADPPGGTVVNSSPRMPTLAEPGPDESGLQDDGIPDTAIERILREVTPYLGPLAKRVVRRSSQRSAGAAELIADLAAQIPDTRQQIDFLKKVRVPEIIGNDATDGRTRTRTQAPAGGSGGVAGATPGERYALSEECLARVNRLLTEYVGPMASHTSRRAIAKSANWQEFSAQLMRDIPNEEERTDFCRRLEAIAHAKA